jgi:hypothetical protein
VQQRRGLAKVIYEWRVGGGVRSIVMLCAKSRLVSELVSKLAAAAVAAAAAV